MKDFIITIVFIWVIATSVAGWIDDQNQRFVFVKTDTHTRTITIGDEEIPLGWMRCTKEDNVVFQLFATCYEPRLVDLVVIIVNDYQGVPMYTLN